MKKGMTTHFILLLIGLVLILVFHIYNHSKGYVEYKKEKKEIEKYNKLKF